MNTDKSNATIQALMAWADKQPKPVLCERCGRPLTDERSKTQGVGPICLAEIEAGIEEDQNDG